MFTPKVNQNVIYQTSTNCVSSKFWYTFICVVESRNVEMVSELCNHLPVLQISFKMNLEITVYYIKINFSFKVQSRFNFRFKQANVNIDDFF